MLKNPIEQNPSGVDRTMQRYRMLYELFHSITSTLEPQTALNLIIDAAVKITGATYGSLILIDWEHKLLNIEVSRGFMKSISNMKLAVGEGITGWVAEHGEPILVPDVSRDDRYVTILDAIRCELAVPMKLKGKTIGVLNVDSTRPNAFTDEDLDLLTLLSKQSVQVIENGRVHTKAQRKVDELSSLININKAILSTLDSEEILRQVVQRAAILMDAALCSIMLISEDGEELVLKAHHGGSAEYAARPPMLLAESPFEQVIYTRGTLKIEDIGSHAGQGFANIAQNEHLKSLLSVPLIGRDRVIGVLNTYKSQRHRFTDDQTMLMKTFADLSAIAIDNAQLYETMFTLEEQARHTERLTSVGELAVSIAHEIRNPLTIIKMLFESGENLNDRDREVISEELHRMNKIITNLLDFTRSKENARERCRVRKILRNALILLERDFEKKQISVTADLAEGLPKILADPVQVQQVFLNLLLNASEAMINGGKIHIQTQLVNNFVEIVICDNGPGLPQSVRRNLFTPFTTTKPKGLGLGLSIVKRIIDSHGGEIRLISEVGYGTEFTIRLPV